MKYPCQMVKDLLPLYYDHVCSESSSKIVEEHLSECSACRSMLKKMEDSTYDDHLQEERENVVSHYTQSVKRKSLSIGIGIACVLAIPIVVCLIINLATGHGLDWFFIVLTSLMVLASLTVVPLVAETQKFLWTLGSFTGSLLLLLGTCCIYSGGRWFFVAAIAIVFGLSVVFLPFVLYQLPLKGFLAQNKGLMTIAVDTILFYALIFVCGLYGNSAGYWNHAFLIATSGLLLPWFLFAVIRYAKIDALIKAGICTIAVALFSAVYNDIIRWILDGVLRISFMKANLQFWHTDILINANLDLLAALTGGIIGVILICVGLFRRAAK